MMYRRIAISTLAIAALGLAACGNDTTPDPADPVQVTPTAQETVEATTPAETTPADDTATTDDDTAEVTDPASETPATDDGAAATGDEAAHLEQALKAIEFAESETGGVAVEIDDADFDQAWEVVVLRPEGNAVEVKLNREATEVQSTEDETDLEVNAPPATTIQDAINAALAHTPGILDDVELDEEDGTLYWEITVEQNGDDVDLYLDTANLQVVDR